MSSKLSILALVVLALLPGCGGEQSKAASGTSAAAADAAPPAPAATGTVIEVKAISDETGNHFVPNKLEAHPGDVLKFTLVSGVHNVSFPADKNPGATGLPEPSDLLQLPGQTLEVPVSFKPGEYHFQCDPHAALGMTGELEVE
ncbi:MAG TPA: plastocyanin/azurin family copper-binding protein [Gemmatimonadales bacterium]|jgi:plastocyanin|nr:plastocyanin/azurin family copper-binding protein [Gemmatimonadales bacterium]